MKISATSLALLLVHCAAADPLQGEAEAKGVRGLQRGMMMGMNGGNATMGMGMGMMGNMGKKMGMMMGMGNATMNGGMMMMGGDSDGRARKLDRALAPVLPALPAAYAPNPVLAGLPWEDLSLDALYDALGCDAVLAGPRAIPDAAAWHTLRKTYEDVVGPGRSSIVHALKQEADLLPADEATVVGAAMVPQKGRGLVAQQDIQAGERLWSDVYLATFYDARDLNRFLAVLPAAQACDVALWQYDHEDDPADFFYSVNLDASSLCNDGGAAAANVAFAGGPVANDFAAARDIAAGEEILCDYENGEPAYDAYNEGGL